MEETAASMQALFDQFAPTLFEYGENVVSAVIILIVGYWVASRLGAAVRRLLDRQKRVDATVKPLIASIVKYLVLTITIIAVLGRFGVQTASIIAVLGAAGLAVGLALQGTLQNIAAGIMLLVLRPVKVGEFVDAEGLGGTVEEIGLFTTKMTTFDGIYVSAPNSRLWNAAITNYSRNPSRRLDFAVGIAYDDDIDAAEKALMDVMEADPRVLGDPAPMTMVTALGDNAVLVNLRCWTAAADFWDAKWAIQKAAKQAVEAAGCTIPFPQRTVHVASGGTAGHGPAAAAGE